MRIFIQRALGSNWLKIACVAFIYILFAVALHKNIFLHTKQNYYTLLLDAFSNGRTNIIPAIEAYDLSLFREKWYLYWGPAPTFFILPFFLIGGGVASDIVYTLIAGILNVAIFGLVIKEFCRYFSLSVTPWFEWIIVGSFALASPNFYLSLSGRIWHTSQIIAMLYLLLSLLFYFKFCRQQKILFLVTSVLFFNLAWLTRFPLIIYGFLFLFPLFKKEPLQKKKKLITVIVGITLIAVFFWGWYNNVRFGSPLETGARFQEGAERFDTVVKSGTFLSPRNITHNIRYYFWNSPFSLTRPFFTPNAEGNSIFLVYPFTLLIFFFLKARGVIHKDLRSFMPYAFAVLGFLMTFLMLFLATGWRQFGNRYFFDVIPLLFLLLIPVAQKMPPVILRFMLLYGFIINMFGIAVFYGA